MIAKILLSPTVVLAPAAEGYLAFETVTERLHQLNATASLIVDLCDGTRDVPTLLALLRPLLGDPDAINTWIAYALRDGLLTESPPTADPLTAEDLASMIEDLRDRGRILPAFLCGRRLAELLPDDPAPWYQLGELAHILGRRDEARIAYQRYQTLQPDDAEIELILLALRDEAPPPRASDRCITQLYARFASFYDSSMGDDLDYQAPTLLEAALNRVLDNRRDLDILDLGCGTGLAGQRLRPLARHLVGLDLSPEMLDLARRRRIYDALHADEITSWLQRDPGGPPFDLITICDALIYFGDLHQVLAPASKRLVPGGRIAFTVERSPTPPFLLNDNGRYTHHADHLTDTASRLGLTVEYLAEEVLRAEYGEPVPGLVAILQTPVGIP